MFTQRGGVCNQVIDMRIGQRHRSHYIRKGFTRNFIKYQELCSSQPLVVKVMAKYHISVVFRVKLPLKLI